MHVHTPILTHRELCNQNQILWEHFYIETIMQIIKLEGIKIPRKKEGAKMNHCLCALKRRYEKDFSKNILEAYS